MAQDIIVNIQKMNTELVEQVQRIADSTGQPSLDDVQTLAQSVLVLNQSVRDLIHAMAIAMSAKVL